MSNLHDNRGFPSVCMEISNHWVLHFALGFTQVETMIAAYFADLRIGFVKHVSLNESPGGERMCTIRFDKWYRNPAADHLRQKILSGRPARLVYDDPHSWELKWAMGTDYIQYGLWRKSTKIQSWWRTRSAVMAYEIQLNRKRGLYQTRGGEWMGATGAVGFKDATTGTWLCTGTPVPLLRTINQVWTGVGWETPPHPELAPYPNSLKYPSDFTQEDIQRADAGRPPPGQGWMPAFSGDNTGAVVGYGHFGWSGIKMETKCNFTSDQGGRVLEFDRIRGRWYLRIGVLGNREARDWHDLSFNGVSMNSMEDRRAASRELCDNE